eukprot:jgi/Psemu1/29854/gm1.29854_g
MVKKETKRDQERQQETELIAKLKRPVLFLSQTYNVQNIDEHFGEGDEVYLSGVFKHLEGSNFKYHTLSDFETWECFEDSKAHSQNFKKSHPGPYAAGWYRTKDLVPPRDKVSDKTHNKGNKSDEGNDKDGNLNNEGDNVSDPRQDKDNKSDEENGKDENLDNNSNLKPTAKPTTLKEPGEKNNSNKSGITAKTVGAKSLVVKGLHLVPKDRMNELEQSVQLLNYILDVTVPKSHLRVGRGFASHDIKVMLKDPDPEISGNGQRNNKGNLLGYDDNLSNNLSSSSSNNMPDKDRGLGYDPAVDGDSEAKEDDEC